MSHHGVRFQSLKDIACHRLLSTGRHHRGSVSADPEASEKPWRKIWGSANWVPRIRNDGIHGPNSQPHLHHALGQSDGSHSFLGWHTGVPKGVSFRKKTHVILRRQDKWWCFRKKKTCSRSASFRGKCNSNVTSNLCATSNTAKDLVLLCFEARCNPTPAMFHVFHTVSGSATVHPSKKNSKIGQRLCDSGSSQFFFIYTCMYNYIYI